METAEIVRRAFELGFVAVGIMRVAPHQDDKLRAWMANDYHADMQFFHRHLPIREDLNQLIPDAMSVISVALPYPDIPDESSKYFAAYSRCFDYHKYIRELLTMLAIEMAEYDNLICIDDKPVPERYAAQKSGVGWLGKNGCVIVPGYGSRVLLGEIITTADLLSTSEIAGDCGDCQLCIDNCPTGALQENGIVDCRRCLSYHTIENRSEIPAEISEKITEMIFGCDRCLRVCPHNNTSHPGLPLQQNIFTCDITTYLSITPENFKTRFRNSPVTRAKRSGFLRNLLILLANTHRTDTLAEIMKLTEDDDPLVRQYAKWAAGKLQR